MKRFSLVVASVVGVAVLGACAGEVPNTAPTEAPNVPAPQVAPTPGTCVDFATLKSQVLALFVNSSPDQNAARGKVDNLGHHVDNQNFASAQAQAFNLVDFVLKKFKQGTVIASEADLITALNNVFCYAGLALQIGDGNNSWIIYPTDQPQTLTTDDQFAATDLPGGIVTEPTLVAINRLTDIFGPGGGPLPTLLDQYPLFYQFTKQNAGNTGFTASVVVGVCSASGIPAEVFSRLRLGHGVDPSTTELTPPAPPPATLNCANAPSLSAFAPSLLPNWLRGLGKFFLPEPLYARRAGGGVGGSTEEFSPFGPVDPQTDMTGGVGGSTGEFLRVRPAAVMANVVSCPPRTAPVGGDIDPTCRPEVTLMTPLYKAWLDGGSQGPQQGNLLNDVPVNFVVETGGGTIAPETGGVCGTYASSITVNTGSDGKARICWKLGSTAGDNSVRATPEAGGTALDGVYFVPESGVFHATANPPTQLVFGQQPTSTTAGSLIAPSPTVIVKDVNGVQVPIATNQITLTLSSNAFTGASTTQVNAAGGSATFSNLAITQAGTYTITASTAGLTSAISQQFTISAAAASVIKTYMPPGPTALSTFNYGNSLTPYADVSPDPRSIVTDQYGNPVGAGVPVFWSTNTSTGSVLDLTGGTQTGADGTAQITAWTLGEGSQTLFASLFSDISQDPAPAQFTAGTPTGLVIFSCGVGTAKVDLGPLTIPSPNAILRDITLQMSVTGQSSAISNYLASLSVRLDGFNGTQVGVGGGTVALPGNNGSPTPVTFHLSTPVPRQTGNHTLWFRLSFSNLPATRKIQLWYNTSFANNSPCKDAKVYSPTYPSPSGVVKAGISAVATN